jgi:hypothetical protein
MEDNESEVLHSLFNSILINFNELPRRKQRVICLTI